MESLIKKIKEKKELSGIADSVIKEALDNYFMKSNINLFKLSARGKKLVIKDIRAELRKYAGRFQASLKERQALLKENKITELLETHSSAKERLDFYPELRRIISSLNVKSILDLACGLNPIALAKKGIKYYALDINSDELEIVKEYFKANKINGKIIVHDLRKPFDYPDADLALIFKVFDVIEKRGHKLAEKILSSLKSRFVIISFPTKTLAGNPMNHPQRGWIEWLLARLDYKFKIIKSRNEIFYLAEKHSCSSCPYKGICSC